MGLILVKNENMKEIEELLKTLEMYQLCGLVFIIYFLIAMLSNKYINKDRFCFKETLITALFGLLFFLAYMTFFAYN